MSFAAFATARKNSSASSVSKSPTRSAGNSPSKDVNGRPEMSIAADARASSIGTTAWPKRRIPARSPSASSIAWPSAMPASSTVWCAPGLEVAVHAHVEVEQPVARHRVEQVVEEADPRRALARARAVEVERQLDVGLAGGAVDLQRCGSRAALHGFCVHRKALGTRERGAGGREAGGRLGGKDTRAIRRRKVAGESADWKRAAPPVGSTWFEPAT